MRGGGRRIAQHGRARQEERRDDDSVMAERAHRGRRGRRGRPVDERERNSEKIKSVLGQGNQRLGLLQDKSRFGRGQEEEELREDIT